MKFENADAPIIPVPAPDIISYSTVLTAMEKGGGPWERAIELVEELEGRRLEGGEGARAVLFASGNAATHAVLASLAARNRERGGDRTRVATEGIGYHGTRDAIAALGPAVEVVGGAAELGEGDVVWLESPRNPDLRVPDVAGACAGPADVVVDATFAPLAQRLLDDVTCVVHSATDGVEIKQ